MNTTLINKTKIFTAMLAFAGLTVMSSCGEGEKKSTDADEVEVNETAMQTEDQENVEETNVVATYEYKMKDGSTVSYDSDNVSVYAVKDWEPYNTVNSEIVELETIDIATSRDRFENLNAYIANLGETIPAWLKTEEVMEDVADVQKEYQELIAELDASEDEQKENLEELSEKFADLREELNEAAEDYIKKNKIDDENKEK